MLELVGKYTPKGTTAKVMIDDIDPETLGQIIQMINHPAFTNSIAVMPDGHYGAGAVIGFTMPMGDKLVPNVVGRDVNCGMLMLIFSKLNFDLNREELDKLIREAVPFGQEVRKRPAYNMERDFPWHKVTELDIMFCRAFNKRFGTEMKPTFHS